MTDTTNPPAAPVRVRLNKDGTASIEVHGATVAEALARLDEVGAGLTARGIPFGIDGAAQVADMAADHAADRAKAKADAKADGGTGEDWRLKAQR